ncbi:hypothetical protein JCM33374_g3944 [Metschnikowia sp. JCM 33374]|nr:hypothetical protein JCM33374_g3944 [Metschnikowia sp. JCM 33374]
MADKELTVFLLDASVPSSSYKYVLDTLAVKLLKGLKTDYVTVALFHSASTTHALASTGKFKGIDVLLNYETVSYSNLRKLKHTLCGAPVINSNPSVECADVIQTVLFASTFFEPTKRKIFTRNIVVITSAHTEVLSKSLAFIAIVPDRYTDYPGVRFHAITVEEDKEPLKSDSVLSKLKNAFYEGSVFTSAVAQDIIDHHPPIRKTRPIAIYKGAMRFGSDFSKISDDDLYSGDDVGISFGVEVYSAAKGDTNISDSHEYIVDTDRNIVKVKRNTSHFVWERNFQGERDQEVTSTSEDPKGGDAEKKFDKVNVDSHSLTSAFKFSNFDLIAVDEDLLQASKLHLFSALDVFAFIPTTKIPYEFLTGEALYLVPEKDSSQKNTSSFYAFIEALHTRRTAALCRFVRKANKEVEVGAAFPVKVKGPLGYTNCFVFVRLPYKEDEKIGRFPSLATPNLDEVGLVEETEVKKAAAVSSLMDEFVNEKTYESDEDSNAEIKDDASEIEHFKITMKYNENSKLAIPQKHTNTNPFLCSSPSVNRYSNYMRKILLNSLSVEDWVGPLRES